MVLPRRRGRFQLDLITGVTAQGYAGGPIVSGIRNSDKMEGSAPNISLGNEKFSACNNIPSLLKQPLEPKHESLPHARRARRFLRSARLLPPLRRRYMRGIRILDHNGKGVLGGGVCRLLVIAGNKPPRPVLQRAGEISGGFFSSAGGSFLAGSSAPWPRSSDSKSV